ncbi:MAG: energy-coupling factor transport system permease protein [Chloroflexota bacterium]|nr:energy-coupling factor transport system permease protein [Chloroflexota bacterium]
MTTTLRGPAFVAGAETRWRTRDIVVAAVIGVAFGVVFWAWGLIYAAAEPLFAFAPPLRDVMYGVWLIPAVLAPLVIRKPGAALFAEMVAAIVSALLGTVWSIDVLLSGFLQGAAAELVFAFSLYRSYGTVVLVLAAVASALAAWVHDWVLYYPTVEPTVQVVRLIVMVISAAMITAGGSVLLARSLRRSGVLDGFPA